MFKITKYLLYLGIAALIWGLFWFMPKYSYVQKNPGYCVNLTKNLYYCGSQADVKEMFETTLEQPSVQDSFQPEAIEEAVKDFNQSN